MSIAEKFQNGEKRTAIAMVVVAVITAVVKLLLEDKISSSWRKPIGEDRGRDHGAVSPRRSGIERGRL